MADPGRPSEEEVAARLEEELRRLRVSDLLVQTLYTVSSLGYQKLAGEQRDLPQARLAIEALRALLPVLEGEVPDDVRRDFGQVVANMQLAYADAVRAAPPEQPKPEQPEPEQPEPEERRAAAAAADPPRLRRRARSARRRRRPP